MLALLAIALLTAMLWFGATRTWFGADDIVSLACAAGLEPRQTSFRPLSTMVAWPLQYAAFRLEPPGYHAVSVVLHGLNGVGVYFLALRLTRRSFLAWASAVIFVASGIAFTAVYSASSVGDLLTTSLLLAATLLYFRPTAEASVRVHLVAALCFLLAVLAKESAIVWPLFLLAAHVHGSFHSPTQGATALAARRRALLVLAATFIAAGWFCLGFIRGGMTPRGAYALEWSPAHLSTNLATYLSWVARIGVPIRDWVAAPDPGALPALLLIPAVVLLAWKAPSSGARSMLTAGGWWFVVFLLPVLPLRSHSYLYYLYLPWAGGALAVAALCDALIEGLPNRFRKAAFAALLGAFVLFEARATTARRSATLEGLPADRTIRDSELLRHAVGSLAWARLPAGTRVGFVNPVPAARLELAAARSTPVNEAASRVRYYPLEALMQDGRTFRVFFPELGYAGFSDTIPSTWGDVECFLFEQRGYLRRWGHGAEALGNQAEWSKAQGRP